MRTDGTSTGGVPAGTASADVVVVGAGSTGLACAAELASRGVRTTVLEQGDRVGAAWAGRYDALRLNTSRRVSTLPGSPFPRAWGQFATRDQLVAYLHDYATSRRIDVRLEVRVRRIEAAADVSGARWRVVTDRGSLAAEHVVVATGLYRTPVWPAWPSRHAFPGRLVHSAHFRDAAPYRGADVVVVGPGASGLEIAHELVAGGAARVRLAVRRPPNLLRRSVGGLPSDAGLPVLLRLPVPLADALAAGMRRLTIGDLAPYGLPRPEVGPFAELRAGHAAASIEPSTIADLRAGRITVVPAVEDVGAGGLHLADGTRTDADAVIAATGFGPGLEPVVGHLGVLDGQGLPRPGDGGEAAAGLRFVGYEVVPGIIGLGGRRAREVAAAIRPTPRRRGRRPSRALR